ncbi:MAG: hypothetical protein ABIQ30_12900 [Devosia sp.]
MRGLLLALLLLTTPAMAQDWRPYENHTMLYAVDVPAGLGQVAETEAGLIIQSPTVTLTVFGLTVAPMDFATAVATSIGSSEDEGFALTERSVTPEWARYLASNGAQKQAVGLVALCDGASIAAYELRYMEADVVAMAPVIERLAGTLRVSRPC